MRLNWTCIYENFDYKFVIEYENEYKHKLKWI